MCVRCARVKCIFFIRLCLLHSRDGGVVQVGQQRKGRLAGRRERGRQRVRLLRAHVGDEQPLRAARGAHPLPAPPPSSADVAAVAAVADYHVALWTSVLLAFVLFAVLYAMLDMGAAPLDAQLRAQVVDKSAKQKAK